MLQTILERFLVEVSKRYACQNAGTGADGYAPNASRAVAVALAKSLISL